MGSNWREQWAFNERGMLGRERERERERGVVRSVTQ
jgi:hypothetical protein